MEYVNEVDTLVYFFNHVFLNNPFISFILTRCLFSIWSLFVHSKMYVDQIFFFSWYFKTAQPQTFIFIKRSVVEFFREPFIHNFNPQTLISSKYSLFWLEKCLILLISPLFTVAKTAQITFAVKIKRKKYSFKKQNLNIWFLLDETKFLRVLLWIGNVTLYLWRIYSPPKHWLQKKKGKKENIYYWS